MEKILYLLIVFISFVGFVNSIGYAIYEGRVHIAIFMLFVGWCAYPKWIEYLKKLIK